MDIEITTTETRQLNGESVLFAEYHDIYNNYTVDIPEHIVKEWGLQNHEFLFHACHDTITEHFHMDQFIIDLDWGDYELIIEYVEKNYKEDINRQQELIK